MNIKSFKHYLMILLYGTFLILGGCATTTQQSNFFVLTPIAKDSPDVLPTSHENTTIGVGPLEFPSYLNRPNILDEVGANQVRLSEFNRWAEPLEENFSRVLAENLSVLLSTDQVSTFPWKSSIPIEFQVTVSVLKFHGRLGADSILECRWAIFRDYGKEVLVMKKSSFTEASQGQDHKALVIGLNKNLEKLSIEIAKKIKSFRP
jgi:uncharacterized protein